MMSAIAAGAEIASAISTAAAMTLGLHPDVLPARGWQHLRMGDRIRAPAHRAKAHETLAAFR
jgi:hypothetical protein